MTNGGKTHFSSPVTALVITYSPAEDVLRPCIKSLLNQNPQPHIIIADNLSPSDPNHLVAKEFESDNCAVLTFDKNHGFAGAINRSLPQIKTPYVLISNFDIVYDPGYVSAAISALEKSDKKIVGIAGKTLFY